MAKWSIHIIFAQCVDDDNDAVAAPYPNSVSDPDL